MSRLHRLLGTGLVAVFLTLDVAAARATVPECLQVEPLQCSLGWGILFRPAAAASIVFVDACVTHDLCYRHGEATYGYDKARCDDEILAAMDATCRREWGFVAYATLGLTRLACHLEKRAIYAALSRSEIAVRSFRTGERSTCCRYDADGEVLPQCEP